MKILLIGNDINFDEAQKKFGPSHTYENAISQDDSEKLIGNNDVIFDFIIEQKPEAFEIYAAHAKPVFLNTTKISLAKLSTSVKQKMKCTVFGFNGLPTLLNRDILEVSLLNGTDQAQLKSICEKLGTKYLEVDDRVGLVTPRVISMIINEAYYTVQEGTASREDIDLAMKLGTNYPFGPFEWCKKIGVRHVYELLDAIYEDTKDERYKICPLLKKEYLKS